MNHLPVLSPPMGLVPSSCGVGKAILCGAATVAAGAACVLTDALGCYPALKAVKAIGCCECLGNSTLISVCNAL
jgi:hypothetical protein